MMLEANSIDPPNFAAAPRPGTATVPLDAGPDETCARFEREALPHLKALYGGAFRLVRNVADAEDLVQETCLRAFRAFDRYTPGTNIRAWLFTILHRVRADHFRKVVRRPQTAPIIGDGPPVAPPQDALARGHEEVTRALLALPESFRAAVVLRDVEDFSYEEIARILSIPIGTVMSRIHRGRGLMRRQLEARAA